MSKEIAVAVSKVEMAIAVASIVGSGTDVKAKLSLLAHVYNVFGNVVEGKLVLHSPLGVKTLGKIAATNKNGKGKKGYNSIVPSDIFRVSSVAFNTTIDADTVKVIEKLGIKSAEAKKLARGDAYDAIAKGELESAVAEEYVKIETDLDAKLAEDTAAAEAARDKAKKWFAGAKPGFGQCLYILNCVQPEGRKCGQSTLSPAGVLLMLATGKTASAADYLRDIGNDPQMIAELDQVRAAAKDAKKKSKGGSYLNDIIVSLYTNATKEPEFAPAD